MHNVVFALPLDEVDQRQTMFGGIAINPGDEVLAHRRHQAVDAISKPDAGSKPHHLPDTLQRWTINVQNSRSIDSSEAFDDAVPA